MTMQLVIGVGSSFLQELVQQTGNSGDIGQLATVMVGVIILAAVAGSSIARAMAAGGAGSGTTGTAMDSYQKLMDRIAVLEGANAAGGGDGAMSAAERNNWTGQGGGVGQGEL